MKEILDILLIGLGVYLLGVLLYLGLEHLKKVRVDKKIASGMLTRELRHEAKSFLSALQKYDSISGNGLAMRKLINLRNSVTLYLRLGGKFKDLNITTETLRIEKSTTKNPIPEVLFGGLTGFEIKSILLEEDPKCYIKVGDEIYYFDVSKLDQLEYERAEE